MTVWYKAHRVQLARLSIRVPLLRFKNKRPTWDKAFVYASKESPHAIIAAI
jgi:hypothetical protein